MSSVAGFKQQCPSCGGQLTIKNPDLIGKRVDCPKCHTRFRVEDPDADIGEPVDTVPRKGKVEKKAKGKSEPDAASGGTAKKGIKKQYILAGVAVAVVAVVGIVIVFTISGSGDKTKGGPPIGTGTGRGSAGQPAPAETPEVRMGALVDKAVADNGGKAEADALVQALSGDSAEDRSAGIAKLRERCLAGIPKAFELLDQAGKAQKAELKELAQTTIKEVEQELAKRDAGLRDDPTNMLPNNTQVVLSIPIKDFADSPFGTAVLRTRGAFRSADFEVRVGIPLSNIKDLVISGNREHGQAFGIIRTFDAMDWESVKRAMQLPDTPAQTIKGKTYFVGKVDFLTEFVGNFVPVAELRQKAGVHKKDEKTLVYGDVKSIEAFLNAPPAFQVEATVGPKVGFVGYVPPPDEEQKPEDKPGEAKPPDQPAAVPPATPGYTGIPGRPDLRTFLTVKPALRRLIERADFKKPALVLFAADTAKDSPALLVPYLNRLKPAQAAQVQMVAIALSQVEQLTLTTAMMCKSKEAAPPFEVELKRILEEAAKGEWKDALGFEFLGPWSEPAEDTITTSPVGRVPSGPPNMPDMSAMYRRMMGQRPMGTGRPSGPPDSVPPPGTPEDSASTGSPDGAPGPTGPPRGYQYPPSVPADPNAPPPDRGDGSRIDFFRQDEFITVLVTVIDDPKSFTEGTIGPVVVSWRGVMDMASGRFGLHTLADAVRAGTKTGYPRGTVNRPPAPERRFRPWPPDQRVSWMHGLLPYLGDDRYRDVYAAIDPALSWKDPKNARLGAVLVPHFLHPEGGRFYTRVQGVDARQAVTHVVGMGGVGPDSPYYDKNDPRAGIFGYDRDAKLEDIKDGASHTILMIQTDPALVGPWIAGGGSTIRGTSETGVDVGEIGGFTSPQSSKPGVYAIMADGAVRFLPKGISPEVFKALSTKAGGDNGVVGDLDRVAPRLDAPGQKPVDPAKAAQAPPKQEPKPKPAEAKRQDPVKPEAKSEVKPEAKPPDKPKGDK